MSAGAPNLDLLDELIRTPEAGRLAVIARAGEPATILAGLSDEAERSIVTGIAAALERTDIVTSLAEQVGGGALQARAKRARARALSYAGRFDEALRLCGEIIGLSERDGLPLEAAHARLVSMHALGEQGRFGEAIAAGEAARQAFADAGFMHFAGRADANIGSLLYRQDNPGAALQHFDRAREALQTDPIASAHVENNRAEALLALNDFDGAEHAFRRALVAFEQNEIRFAASIVMGNLADLSARQGRLHEALQRFERARRHLESESSSGHLARLLAEQAEAMALLGLPDEAAGTYQTAIAALEQMGLALELARARTGQAMALLRLGRFVEAERVLDRAIAECAQLGHAASRARAQLLRAQLLAARNQNGEARRIVEEAAAVLRDRPADSAVAHHLLARLAIAAGDLDSAEREIESGLDAANRFQLRPLQADLLHARSLVHRQRNRGELAIADLTEAVEHVERVRGSLQAERFRAAFLADRLAIYEELVSALLDRADADSVARAFAVAERAKSRSLLDVVRGVLDVTDFATSDAADAGEAQLLERITALRQRLNALYSRLADEAQGEGLRFVRSTLPAAIREHERELDVLEHRLTVTRGVATLMARPVELQHAATLLERGHALIEYFVADGELLAFALGPDGSRVFRGLGHMREINELVSRLQFQINRVLRPGTGGRPVSALKARRTIDDARRELHAFHAILLQPMNHLLMEIERVTIVPHGSLHLVPFHALWNGERHLIESHEVSYTPSASLLALLAEESAVSSSKGAARRAESRAVVVGVADEAAPSIAHEAIAVAQCFHADSPVLLTGERATVDDVCDAARDASIVHFACHGRFSSETPRGSGLKLADRWLTVRDIYRMKLSADLVTLSGCETGRNVVHAGDELMGLLRGFFAAGAASLLVSLWRVNDESAMELMRLFYGWWHRLRDSRCAKAAALRSAQLDMMKLRPHPAFWAPFALVGRP